MSNSLIVWTCKPSQKVIDSLHDLYDDIRGRYDDGDKFNPGTLNALERIESAIAAMGDESLQVETPKFTSASSDISDNNNCREAFKRYLENNYNQYGNVNYGAFQNLLDAFEGGWNSRPSEPVSGERRTEKGTGAQETRVSRNHMPDGRLIFGEDSPHDVGEHLDALVKDQPAGFSPDEQYRQVRACIEHACISNGKGGWDIDLDSATRGAIAAMSPMRESAHMDEERHPIPEGTAAPLAAAALAIQEWTGGEFGLKTAMKAIEAYETASPKREVGSQE